MVRRKKKGGGEFFDRTTLSLVICVFVVGIVVGFFFGRRSAQVSKIKSSSFAPILSPLTRGRGKSAAKPGGSDALFDGGEGASEEKQVASLSLLPSVGRATKARVAFVVGDVGNDNHQEDLLWAFPHSVTLAILPNLPYSEYFAREGARRGFEIILHQPMEPTRKFERDDPGMIYVKMTEAEITQTLINNLKTVPTAVGLNNHKGSLATQNQNTMNAVFRELKHRQLFFLDSLTTPFSIGRGAARKMKLPYLARDVFLDNELEPDYIHGQIGELASLAKRNGSAVGIGHYKASTLAVLKDEIVRLEKEGFEVVSLKELL